MIEGAITRKTYPSEPTLRSGADGRGFEDGDEEESKYLLLVL